MLTRWIKWDVIYRDNKLRTKTVICMGTDSGAVIAAGEERPLLDTPSIRPPPSKSPSGWVVLPLVILTGVTPVCELYNDTLLHKALIGSFFDRRRMRKLKAYTKTRTVTPTHPQEPRGESLTKNTSSSWCLVINIIGQNKCVYCLFLR